MLRRCVYHIIGQPIRFLHSAVSSIVLLLFLLSSALSSGLIDIFNDIAGKNMNLTVTMVSAFTDPVKDVWSGEIYLQDEREYVDAVHQLNDYGTFQNKDLEVIYRFPLVSSYMNENGTVFSLNDVRTVLNGTTDLWNETVNPIINFLGIESSTPEALRMKSINMQNGSFLTEENILNEEMVCVLPLTYAFYMADDGQSSSVSTGDDFIISSFAFDKNHAVVSSKTWKLKIIGFYSQSYDADGFTNCVYMPRGTIQRIRDEALSFQEENHSALLNESIQSYQIGLIYPAFYTCTDFNQMKDFIQYAQRTDGYQKHLFMINSELTDMAPVLTSLYTTTSSFKIITGIVFIMAMIFAVANTVLECIYRKKEMTLLQTMGERKERIILQVLLEKGMVLILSLLIAVPLSRYLVGHFAVSLFASSINDRNSAIGEAAAHSFSTYKTEIAMTDIQTQLRFNWSTWLIVGLFILLLLVLQAGMTSRMLKDFEPRKTLSGGDS